jgi:hypothetical protein
MASKATDLHQRGDDQHAARATTPPWTSASKPDATFLATQQRLAEQLQDLKNMAYADMTPDNKTRLDAVLNTFNAMRTTR